MLSARTTPGAQHSFSRKKIKNLNKNLNASFKVGAAITSKKKNSEKKVSSTITSYPKK